MILSASACRATAASGPVAAAQTRGAAASIDASPDDTRPGCKSLADDPLALPFDVLEGRLRIRLPEGGVAEAHGDHEQAFGFGGVQIQVREMFATVTPNSPQDEIERGVELFDDWKHLRFRSETGVRVVEMVPTHLSPEEAAAPLIDVSQAFVAHPDGTVLTVLVSVLREALGDLATCSSLATRVLMTIDAGPKHLNVAGGKESAPGVVPDEDVVFDLPAGFVMGRGIKPGQSGRGAELVKQGSLPFLIVHKVIPVGPHPHPSAELNVEGWLGGDGWPDESAAPSRPASSPFGEPLKTTACQAAGWGFALQVDPLYTSYTGPNGRRGILR
jgi:hypothetical protein